MWLDIFKAVIPTVIGGAFLGWLFASVDTVQLARKRLSLMGGFLYKLLGLFGGVAMSGGAIYQFVVFGRSEAPITRLEVIELFCHALNFMVYLPATIALVAYWVNAKKLADRA